MSESICRCGWDGQGDHPCHWGFYKCRKPAKDRFIVQNTTPCLAGSTPKMTGYVSYACDAHWEQFNIERTDNANKNIKS